MKPFKILILALTLAAFAAGSLWAADPKAATPGPALETAAVPDPKAELQKMCDFLKQQQRFSFTAAVTNDQVYAGGRKLQYGLKMHAFFRRPDKLRINGVGDVENKQLIFNGKTLTLYDGNKNFYATMAKTGDLDAALDKAHKDYGLHVGLAELGSNHLWDYANRDLDNTLYVGLAEIQGVPCYHLAFDKKDVQYQLWIETGDRPLLRKVVVTQKTLPSAPQWTAIISDWNFAPQFPADLFTFTPPAGAQKIKFMPLKKAAAPAPKAGTAPQQGGAS